MALTIILGSMATGAWLIWLAVKPWAGSMAAVSNVEKNGSAFYKPTPRSNTLYVNVTDSLACMNEDRINRAFQLIDRGAAMDPSNPLYDCLRASAHWRVKDVDNTMAAIQASEKKGTLKVYCSSLVDPGGWRWGEIELISRTAREIGNAYPQDREKLLAAAVMADKIVWSEPPDLVRVLQGISARNAAIGKLRYLAEQTGDKETAVICEKMIAEGNAFRRRMNWAYSRKGPLANANRAWAVEKTLKDRGSRLNAANLLVLDASARWALECREKTMSRGLMGLLVEESRKRSHSGADRQK